MLPTIVLVGRPNVGKSTLFNRLTQTREALVADLPGLTRDRHYGRGRGGDRPYLVVDTGGFEPEAKTGIYHAMAKQTRQAIAEVGRRYFSGRCARGSRRAGPARSPICCAARDVRVLLAVNKSEGLARGARDGRLPRTRPRRAAADLVRARRQRQRPSRARARGMSAAGAGRAGSRRRSERSTHQGRHRRPAQRRQVDADQYAARRGARDRIRRAGHHARLAVPRLRPRRAATTR